jgi:hypothetical protein
VVGRLPQVIYITRHGPAAYFAVAEAISEVTQMTNDSFTISVLFVLFALFYLRYFKARDYYVVIREYRTVQPGEFGKGKKIKNFYVHHFDDYLAARAFFDLNEGSGATPSYEDQQNINYLYAVSAITADGASKKMSKKVHHQARLLVETPHSSLSALRKHWDEERKVRAELAAIQRD